MGAAALIQSIFYLMQSRLFLKVIFWHQKSKPLETLLKAHQKQLLKSLTSLFSLYLFPALSYKDNPHTARIHPELTKYGRLLNEKVRAGKREEGRGCFWCGNTFLHALSKWLVGKTERGRNFSHVLHFFNPQILFCPFNCLIHA